MIRTAAIEHGVPTVHVEPYRTNGGNRYAREYLVVRFHRSDAGTIVALAHPLDANDEPTSQQIYPRVEAPYEVVEAITRLAVEADLIDDDDPFEIIDALRTAAERQAATWGTK